MTQTIVDAPEIDTSTIELPLEMPKPMKLSEAMRLGSIATTQAVGHWSKDDPTSEGGHAMCAMSTAWYALTGGDGNDAMNTPLVQMLNDTSVAHPENGAIAPLSTTIMELNDAQEWSRTQIADWLETLGL